MPDQLKIEGGSTPTEAVPTRRRPDLSPAQRAIMRQIAEAGSIRSVEAGVIIHRQRGGLCAAHDRHVSEKAIGCCSYAPADGNEAMKRLAARGLVEKIAPGVWIARR